jgi:hypothetical protein
VKGTAVGGVAALALAAVLASDPAGSVHFSTYVGGSGREDLPGAPSTGLAVDKDGSVYLVGSTTSLDFPLHEPWQHGRDGPCDAFVVKLDAEGRTVYATYLGGSAEDYGHAIAVDAEGRAYVTGRTRSDDFPGEPPADGGAFVVKLDPQGFFLYSRFVAAGGAQGRAIALDATGAIYVAGDAEADARVHATATALSAKGAGGRDAFVAKLDREGALVYATRLGGSADDAGSALAVDAGGSAYLAGATRSADFPKRAPASASARSFDTFVAKLDPTGATVLYATALAGTAGEAATAVAVDADGRAYVAGAASSSLPASRGEPVRAHAGGAADAFVAALATDGGLLAHTFMGGSGEDVATGIALGAGGRVFVTGTTRSADFPWMATDPSPSGARDDADVFLMIFGPELGAIEAACFGGRADDHARALALEAPGAAFIAGTTGSEDFPVVGRHASGPSKTGAGDAFVVKWRGGNREGGP